MILHGRPRPRAESDAAESLEDLLPDNDVGDARLVLERDEHDALGRAGSLSDEHDAGDVDSTPVAQGDSLRAGQDALARELAAQEGERMPAQREADMAEGEVCELSANRP